MMQRDLTAIAASVAKAILNVPTGDNCQPFTMTVDNDFIDIYHHHEAARHVLNQRQMGSLLSLGCVVEAIAVATSRLALVPTFALERDEIRREDSQPRRWLRVSFMKAARTLDPLAEAMDRRVTDRRPYRPAPLAAARLEPLFAHPEIRSGRFYTDGVTDVLRDVVLRSEDYLYENPAVFKDIVKHARLTRSEIARARDGMTAPNLNLNAMETLSFRLLRRFPGLLPLLWPVAMRPVLRRKTSHILDHTGALIIYTGDGDGVDDLVAAGRRCYRLWLELTRASLAVQPMSITPFGIAAALQATPPPTMSPRFVGLFRQNHARLKQRFQWRDHEVPLWMLRVGEPLDQAPPVRAPRKRPEDIQLGRSA